MSTENYFVQNAKNHEWFKNKSTIEFPYIERIGKFYTEHYRLANRLTISGIALGIFAFLAIGITHSFLNPSFSHLSIVVLSSVGTPLLFFSIISYLAFKVLGIYFPPQDFESPFKSTTLPEKYKEEMHGELIELTKGHFCLKILNGNDPVDAGKTRGYLTAHALHKHLFKIRMGMRVMKMFHPNLRALMASKDLIKEMIAKLPQDLRTELESIVEGFQLWCKDNNKSDYGFSIEELYRFHLDQEITQVDFSNSNMRSSSPMGCTSFVVQDPDKGMQFMRHLDWESAGIFHLMTLLIATDYGETKTLELGFAGLMSTFTAMNNHGLGLAMNVSLLCTSKNDPLAPNTIPSAFYNKICSKKKSTQEIIELIQNRNIQPMAPYHLTVADEKSAKTIHFKQMPELFKGDWNTFDFSQLGRGDGEFLFQGENWEMLKTFHLVRNLKEGEPLFITNTTYIDVNLKLNLQKEHPEVETGEDSHGCLRSDEWYSFEREQRLKNAWEASLEHAKQNGYPHSPETVSKWASKIPIVNNLLSIHAVHMNLKTKTFSFAFAGNYAGSLTKVDYSLEDIFNQ